MKKGLLFSLMATFLAGIWFGGVSLADCETSTGLKAEHVASITVGSTTNYYCSLAAAIGAVGDEQTEVVLLKDWEESPTIDEKDIILNLGNKTLTVGNYGVDTYESTLLVTNGTVNVNGGFWFYLNNGNTFTLDNTAKIIGGGVGIISDLYPYNATANNMVVINGEINIDGTAIMLDNASTLSVNEGAKVVGINGILVADETDSEKVELNKNASNVNVNGYVGGSNVGITINGNITSITECPTITIGSNAEIVTDGDETVGLYLAGYGKTTIADGAKMSGTASAIEIRAGELTVNGGTFTSTADNFSITPNWNGSTTVWAAIAVSQHTTDLPISVIVNSWTFNWVKALYEEDVQNEIATGDIAIRVTDGIFNWDVFSQNVSNFLEWWIFSLDPSDYIEEWYTALEKESKFYVMSLADAATDESNTANIQLPEWVTVNTWAWDVTMDLSDDITAYLSWDIDTAVSIEDNVLTWEIQDAWYQSATVVWTVLLDFWGSAVFSTPIAIRIPVSWESPVKVKVKHGTDTYGYTGLTLNPDADCNADWSVASDAYTWTDITPVNNFAVIYTCSASTFVAYTEIANPTHSSSTSWWGGWGGSSSSYSCKSLPANAVANNTSKPKKDTNYSYSTDTGAVCTFQCKAGYTRNEKNEKCEKSSETLTDTDKEGTEKVDTTDTSDTAFEDLRKVLDDGYNVEFHNAYNFAFKNGITTMPNIQAADMNSPLTRIAMAKMLSKYAINVLKKTPDTTKTISFPDVSAELDAEYNNGVTLAYQLWIMWVNIENFRPDDLVTRAEFVTALSRMLFGLADGENLYYETHMQKLLDENIITVDNPNMHELRGYVMIMLMRSVKNN